MLQAISANVSSEGQSLYIAISKTISDIRWNNSEIVVWNQEVKNQVMPNFQRLYIFFILGNN